MTKLCGIQMDIFHAAGPFSLQVKSCGANLRQLAGMRSVCQVDNHQECTQGGVAGGGGWR